MDLVIHWNFKYRVTNHGPKQIRSLQPRLSHLWQPLAISPS